MAYKVKYRLDYCNKEKLNARLDFEIKDYTSTIIHNIVGTQNAFSYKVRNEKPDRSGYFRTLEADINIFEDENFNIDNLLTSDETKIRVKFYIEGQIEFVGFIIPDFFEVSIDKPRVISMVASDRIGTLKNQTLPRQTGVQSYRYMLEQSLLKTGLDLTINSTINFNPVGETGDFLTKTGGLMERLSSDKGASISCYDIIKSILIVSNAFLLQEKGQWHILNKLEYESRPKTKDIEQINVGGRRLINPPSSKVGVMAEFGGTPSYPKNYNFRTLEGWHARFGFNVALNTKKVDEIVGNTVTYDGESVNNSARAYGNTHMWNISDETLNPALESSRAKVFSLNKQLIDAKLSINATVAHRAVGTPLDYIYFRYTIFAESPSETLYYDGNSFRKYGSKPKESGWITAEKLDGNGAQEINQSVNFTLTFDDIDNTKNVNDYSFYVRIYGAGTDNTVFLNLVKIEFQDKEEHPKGNLYKIEQGVNFTKESEIDTTVFGGYINKGVNGYFYNYQRDELNQIYYKIGSRWESFGLKWQTANNNTADYLLLHSVRQRAIMFSAPHDIITATVSGRFSPLDIYDVCGSKFVLVEAQYDFYRNETELRIEEIKYDNSVLKTDFIYSYFGGEDTTSISGVSGVSSGGGTGGGGTPCLIKIDDEGNYYVEENFYSLKDVSAFGKDNLGGGGGGDGATALEQLSDVLLTSPAENQILRFINGMWRNVEFDVDLSNYATIGYVNSAINDINVDFTGYATIDYVDSTFLTKVDFNELFEKEVISGKTYIKAKHSLYSTGDLSAFGKDNLGGGGGEGGATSLAQLDDVLLSTPTDNQILSYSSVDGLWKNVNLDFDLTDVASNTRVDGINNRLVTVEANYTTQSDIDTAIDGIEIGGRNYVALGSVDYYPTSTTKPIATSYNSFQVEMLATSMHLGFAKHQAELQNKNCVFSGYIKVNGQVPSSMPNSALYSYDGTSSLLKYDNVTGYFVYEMYPTHGRWSVSMGGFISGDIVTFTKPMYQIGNKATDWSPAPEDQVSDWNTTDVTSFSFIKNKPTQLSQFIDNIGVASHIANKANPHNVTTSQIGALPLTGGTLSGGLIINNPSNPFEALKIYTSASSGDVNSRILFTNYYDTAKIEAQSTPTASRAGILRLQTKKNTTADEWNVGITIDRIGNVGIGTTSPAYKLDVAGTGRFTGNVTASAGINTPKVDFGNGFTIEPSGSELVFKYNGVIKQRITAAGHIIAHGDVTAFG